MKAPLGQIKDVVTTVGNQADKFHESSEERQKELTKRLEIDMASDNKLSKMIRPLTLLILLFFEGLVIVLDAFDYTVPTDTKIQLGVLLAAAIGFYFDSKKSERTAQKNAEANLKIEMMKTKAEINRQKREDRKQRNS